MFTIFSFSCLFLMFGNSFLFSRNHCPVQAHKIGFLFLLFSCSTDLLLTAHTKDESIYWLTDFWFLGLLTSIFTFFFFGEIRNLTTLCLLNNNGFSLSSFFSWHPISRYYFTRTCPPAVELIFELFTFQLLPMVTNDFFFQTLLLV